LRPWWPLGPVGPDGARNALRPPPPGGAGESLRPLGPGGARNALQPLRPGGALGPDGARNALRPLGPGGARIALRPLRPDGARNALRPLRPGGAGESLRPLGPGGALGTCRGCQGELSVCGRSEGNPGPELPMKWMRGGKQADIERAVGGEERVRDTIRCRTAKQHGEASMTKGDRLLFLEQRLVTGRC